MRNSRLLSTLGFSLILGTPGCGGFIPLGNDDAGVGGGGSTAGGSSVGVGGSSVGVLDAGIGGGICFYNGVTYQVGATFTATDGCRPCTCSSNGSVACASIACAVGGANGGADTSCVYNGVTHWLGDSFKSTDGCNTCSCSSYGGVTCTLMGCGVAGGSSGAGGSGTAGGWSVAVGGTVGASPICPSLDLSPSCSNYQIIYDPDTGCASGHVCPAQDAGVCACSGTSPAVANQVCPDGSIGGPICTTLSSGACGWAMRGCPTAGAGGAAAVDGGSSVAGSSGINVCVENNIVHNQGDVFRSMDGCNTCQCTAYGTMCTTLGCAVSCPAIDLVMPQCNSGYSAVLQYDSVGCPVEYACQVVIN